MLRITPGSGDLIAFFPPPLDGRATTEEQEAAEELAAGHPKLRDLDEPQPKGEEYPRFAEEGDQEFRASEKVVCLSGQIQKFLEKG